MGSYSDRQISNRDSLYVYECMYDTCICWLFATFFAGESSIPSDSGNQTIIEGSKITLFSNTSGKPDPNVTWTMENGNGGGEVSFENPWVIGNVSRNDIGTYRCTANNGVGSPVSRLLYVNVTCKYKKALHWSIYM